MNPSARSSTSSSESSERPPSIVKTAIVVILSGGTDVPDRLCGVMSNSSNRVVTGKGLTSPLLLLDQSNILKVFPMFQAGGSGPSEDRARFTVDAINGTVGALLLLADAEREAGNFQADLLARLALPESQVEKDFAQLFNDYGSDKGVGHGYHRVYAYLVEELSDPSKILEIGLGTNFPDVVSTMGVNGSPGASLRAFRDYCPRASIFGADIDSRVLFSEERIQTFFVDQCSSSSLHALGKQIGGDFDLMIDDGLHAPHANLWTLNFFLSRLGVGGFAVIEDIKDEASPIWRLAQLVIPQEFSSALVSTGSSNMFVVRRDR